MITYNLLNSKGVLHVKLKKNNAMERERKLRSFFIHLIRIYLSQYTYREMSAEMHMGNRTLQRMRAGRMVSLRSYLKVLLYSTGMQDHHTWMENWIQMGKGIHKIREK